MIDLDNYQRNYVDQPYEKHQIEFRRREILKRLRCYKHDAILEVGCGLEPLFTKYNGYTEMTIVEPASDFARAADLAIKKSGKDNCRLVKGLLQEVIDQLVGRNYDFIIVSSLLHEIEDPLLFLRHIRRLCSASTIVHINVPNAYSFHRLLAVKMNLIATPKEISESQVAFQQYHTFTLEDLLGIITKANFKAIHYGSYAFKPFTHSQMQKMIDDGNLSTAMLEGLSLMHEDLPGLGSEIFADMKIGGHDDEG